MRPISIVRRKLQCHPRGSYYVYLPKWWAEGKSRYDEVCILVFDDFIIITTLSPSEVIDKIVRMAAEEIVRFSQDAEEQSNQKYE